MADLSRPAIRALIAKQVRGEITGEFGPGDRPFDLIARALADATVLSGKLQLSDDMASRTDIPAVTEIKAFLDGKVDASTEFQRILAQNILGMLIMSRPKSALPSDLADFRRISRAFQTTGPKSRSLVEDMKASALGDAKERSANTKEGAIEAYTDVAMTIVSNLLENGNLPARHYGYASITSPGDDGVRAVPVLKYFEVSLVHWEILEPIMALEPDQPTKETPQPDHGPSMM